MSDGPTDDTVDADKVIALYATCESCEYWDVELEEVPGRYPAVDGGNNDIIVESRYYGHCHGGPPAPTSTEEIFWPRTPRNEWCGAYKKNKIK